MGIRNFYCDGLSGKYYRLWKLVYFPKSQTKMDKGVVVWAPTRKDVLKIIDWISWGYEEDLPPHIFTSR